ncbi:MAG: hypothetical protein ACLP5H_06370 [Desulfomonilaceae bacterium]
MAINRVLGVSIVVLMTASIAQGQSWQGQPQSLQPGVSPVPQGAPPVDQSYVPTPPGYGSLPQPPSRYQAQPIPADQGTVSDAPPPYQYPPYHNPYYNGASAGEFLSGTVDWLFSLPSGLIDRVANFMDGNFFPQSPATHGGPAQSEVQGGPSFRDSPAPVQSLPPAAVYQPDSR